MKRIRIFALLMTAALLLPSLPAVQAAEDWLIPKTLDPPAFTDIAGTIAEQAADVCFQTGLMTGVDNKHFMPANGLSNAQILVISARLHRLLDTGTLGEFDSYHLPQSEWWRPYNVYFQEQLPSLTSAEDYTRICENPAGSCSRRTFFNMLAAVLHDTETALPQVNSVNAVPDCQAPEIMQFYQAGVLGGKDQYGTLDGNGPLTRGAAAAMLARLIDPTQRLTLSLERLDLCRLLLDAEPDTPLMVIDGKTVTAEQFILPYASSVYYYAHHHFAAMGLEMEGGWEGDEAVEKIARFIQAEALAETLGVTPAPDSRGCLDGYMGLTAAGQQWYSQHEALLSLVEEAVEEAAWLGEVKRQSKALQIVLLLPI